MEKVAIKTPNLRLDQFLKWANLAGSGGEAKQMIVQGYVYVNGDIESKRGKTLSIGDIVEFNGKKYQVTAED
ncbi:MAG: RNA-binding S4 domain-containing protein [Carboxydocellales bacterium]